MKKMLLSLAVAFVALACRGTEFAQNRAEIKRNDNIPAGYQTYSLFLVCNPQWLDQDRSGDLHNLYVQFQNFGRAIGDDHLAVWFWKSEGRTSHGELAQDVDVERSVRFCQAWKLKPSEGPHVVVTSTYPKESDRSSGLPKNSAVFTLGNMVPKDISALLAKLTDDLVQNGHINSSEAAQPAPPGLWVRLLEATQQTINSFGCAWTFKIEAGPVNANLKSCKTQ
jgi:hypothetical protein